jgi:hypothetical protein
MDLQQTIRDIILLPKKFYSQSNNSMDSLLKESGYFEVHDKIQVNDIAKILNEYSENIEDWSILSENKRTDSGWYFKKNKSGKYIVGYFSQNSNSHPAEYTDMKEACAAFIKLEIENIRMV